MPATEATACAFRADDAPPPGLLRLPEAHADVFSFPLQDFSRRNWPERLSAFTTDLHRATGLKMPRGPFRFVFSGSFAAASRMRRRRFSFILLLFTLADAHFSEPAAAGRPLSQVWLLLFFDFEDIRLTLILLPDTPYQLVAGISHLRHSRFFIAGFSHISSGFVFFLLRHTSVIFSLGD